jgi:uncharacterized protein (TIGR03067 family)
MRTAPRSTVAFAVLSLLLTGSTLIPEAERRPNAKMVGTWNVIGGERLGKDYTAILQGRQIQWVVGDDEIRVLYKNIERTRYTYKVDLSKEPAHLDLRQLARDMPAICKCEGNRLLICMPISALEKQRPTELKSPPQPRTILYILEREPLPKP